MTDDDLARRYNSLRAAAAEVLHAALRTTQPAPYTPELQELHRLLLETRPATELADYTAAEGSGDPVAGLDPARYSLAFTDYRDDGSAEPYALPRLAAEIQEDLAGDRATGEHLRDEPVRDVSLTQPRALVIGHLLQELSARLSPGPAVGTVEDGRELARIAKELGTKLINMTSAGAQQ